MTGAEVAEADIKEEKLYVLSGKLILMSPLSRQLSSQVLRCCSNRYRSDYITKWGA